MNNKNRTCKIAVTFIQIAFVCVVILIIAKVLNFYYLTLPNFIDEHGKTKLNEFGDFVGGTLNPLLSFFGFMALLYTVFIQRKQLQNDKNAQEKQQFESTFFSLLDMHNQILEQSKSDLTNKLQHFHAQDCSMGFDGDEENEQLCKEVQFKNLCIAKKSLERQSGLYQQYFRILFQLLKFIATNSPDATISLDFDISRMKIDAASLNEKMYSNVIKALLPDEALCLLAVHAYCDDKKNMCDYKFLIERYGIFEHASFNPRNNKSNLPDIFLDVQNFYDKKAFGL